jgi:hypothetical protein
VGTLELKKRSVSTEKERIIRLIFLGKLFAASAIFGNQIIHVTGEMGRWGDGETGLVNKRYATINIK